MFDPIVDIPSAGPYRFERLHQLHGSDENGVHFDRVDLAMHVFDPRGDAVVAPFVESDPRSRLPILSERNFLSGIGAKQRPARLAVARSRVPRGEFALIVPDTVYAVSREHFCSNLNDPLMVIA